MTTSDSHDLRCPVCGAPCAGPPLVTYSADRAATHFCPRWRDQDRHDRLLRRINELWGSAEVRILECTACTFAFGDPFISGDEEFYAILHEQMGYPEWRWDFSAALQHPYFASVSGRRVLDIGAGDGAFLERLGERWDRHAVEGSESTRSLLRAKGITVHENLEAAYGGAPGSFHVITLFQTLEHVAAFYPLLALCRGLIHPDGVLFITVPDGGAMREQEEITGCPDMPPNHIARWTPHSLALALGRSGFTPSESVQEPAALKNVSLQLYHKILADAARPGSLAAQAYRIRQKRVRAPILRTLGLLAFFRLLPHLFKLPRGGAFLMAAQRKTEV